METVKLGPEDAERFAAALERIPNMQGHIRDWCEAMNAWSRDCSENGGLPTTKTRCDLYVAGRKLFANAGVDPHRYGVYYKNAFVERDIEGMTG